MTAISPDEIMRLSALSILNAKGTDLFTFYVVTDNGELTGAQTRVLVDIAEKYGSNELTFSAQSTIAVRGIPYKHINAVLSLLNQANLTTGGTGARIHPIVACRGTNCRFGLCDTLSLYHTLHQHLYLKYRHIELPHKLKIAIGGCPNNCVKPTLSDIGIMGQVIPALNSSVCRNCTNCSVQSGCPVNAVSASEAGNVHINPDLCTHCGRCVSKCPFDAITHTAAGMAVYIGGRGGKKIESGQPFPLLFKTEDEVLGVLERAFLFYKKQGLSGERFADTIDRLGFETVKQHLLSEIASNF